MVQFTVCSQPSFIQTLICIMLSARGKDAVKILLRTVVLATMLAPTPPAGPPPGWNPDPTLHPEMPMPVSRKRKHESVVAKVGGPPPPQSVIDQWAKNSAERRALYPWRKIKKSRLAPYQRAPYQLAAVDQVDQRELNLN